MTNTHPLKWIRQRIFGVTQGELARFGGVSRPRVSRFETGADNPSFDFMRGLRDEARRQGKDFSGDWFFEVPAEEEARGSAEAQP